MAEGLSADPRGVGPHVHAKELQSVQLLRELTGWSRLDVGPFYALFIAVTLKMILDFTGREWDTLTTTSRILGFCVLLRVLLFLFTQWLISVRLFVSFRRASSLEDATSVLVLPAKFVGTAEIVSIERRILREGLNEIEEIGFEFRKQRYTYNQDNDSFEKLKFPVQETFENYLKSNGLGSNTKALAAHDKYGENHYEVPLPAFSALLQEHMLAPFFCFQVFCVGLWCLDSYWYYSLFTLFMLVTFECTVVGQRLRNLKELRQLQTPKQGVHAYRNGKWCEVKGEGLLPGDVISIGRPSGAVAGDDERVVPADCLLLAGSCIVEEAVLTGESTPQWKAAIADAEPATRLVISQDKHHVLFSGTRILQHTGDKAARHKTPDGGCLAIVLRTGFETSQGQLMRTILYSTERITANNVETGLFILFLLCFAVSASLYVLVNGLEDPERDRFKLILNCVMIVTSVIPPELPMELSIAVNASLVALARKRVFCTEPFRIPFGGKVEVCCFDKTGTLTSDHLLLEGILGAPGVTPGSSVEEASSGGVRGKRQPAVSKGKLGEAAGHPSADGGSIEGASSALAPPGARGELVRAMQTLPLPVARIMATCHSLVQVQDELVGDPLEKACIEAIGWSYVADLARSPAGNCKATVLHRHHFSSNLKRMSVVARVEATDEAQPCYEVMLKGAPEVVKQFIVSPPADYDRLYKSYAAKGARVIALARRRLGKELDLDAAQVRALSRQDVESSGLEFAGFAVFSCPLKPESEPALRELAESSHQLMMITGDAPLTACFAASQVHIVTRQVLVLSHRAEEIGHVHGISKAAPRQQEDDSFVWMSPDEVLQIPFSRDWQDILEVAAEHDLCLSGDALAFIEAIGLAQQVIPLTQVFARVSPEQKELVLVTLRAVGRTTLMCGDGTNDVGGLKAAHVGVALLSANESFEKLMNMRSADRKEKAEKAAAALAALDAEQHNKESIVYKKAQLLALQTKAEAEGNRLVARMAPKEVKRKRQGEEMLEKLRASGKPVPARMEKMAKWMDDMEEGQGGGAIGDMPMLKPGDASMASPFTAKASSVAPCCDIIKQGRATLVTTVTMFKILGLLCLSTAYALSVMYLQGVKLSDVQATCTGMLSAAMFFFISNAKPLPHLSPVRPHPSIFNPYFFLSLLGQFATHLGLLMYMYNLALREMPKDERQGSDADFKPNLVNSVCYIVEAVVQLSTFTVNYMGHPHNTSIIENRPMFNSIRIGAVFIAVVALDFVPGLGQAFGLVTIPPHIRVPLITLSVGMVAFNFWWERWLRVRFPAPVPPSKGYMSHLPELEQARARVKKSA